MTPAHPRSRRARSRTLLILAGTVLAAPAAILSTSVIGLYRAAPSIRTDYVAEQRRAVRAFQGMPEDAENGWATFIDACEAIIAIENGALDAVSAAQPDVPSGLLSIEWTAIGDASRAADLAAVRVGDGGAADAAAAILRSIAEDAERRAHEHGLDARLDALAAEEYFVIDHARHEGLMPGSGRTDGPMNAILRPYLGPARKLGRYAIAVLERAARAGDQREVVRRIGHVRAVIRTLELQGPVLERAVAIGLKRQLSETIAGAAVSGRLDRPTLSTAAAALEVEWDPSRLRHALEIERFFVLDFIQRVYTDDGSGGGMFLPAHGVALDGEELNRWSNLRGPLHPGRRLAESETDRLFDQAALAAGEIANPRVRIPGHMDLRWAPVDVLQPALWRALHEERRTLAAQRAAKLILSVEQHRMEHGRLPVSVDEMPAVQDPFAADGCFRYRLTNDPPGFLLYSVGRDGTDNGGTFDDSDTEGLRTGNDWLPIRSPFVVE